MARNPSQVTAAEIAVRLGLRRYPRSWRGRCPACGYPESFVLSRGQIGGATGWCASCQDKDAVREALHCEDAQPARETPQEAATTAERKQQARVRALALWSGSEPATPDNPGGKYLIQRHLTFAIGNLAIRFRGDMPHPSNRKYAALVCRIDNPAGELVAIQRVYLSNAGHKASVEPVKACKGPIWGAAIRFGIGSEIVVAEGPETALAAGHLIGLPSWSAISAGNLAKGLVLPDEVQAVTIAADHDKAGIDAAETAARRWTADGRQVRIVKPDQPGDDFADVLARRAGDAA